MYYVLGFPRFLRIESPRISMRWALQPLDSKMLAAAAYEPEPRTLYLRFRREHVEKIMERLGMTNKRPSGEQLQRMKTEGRVQ